MANGRSKVIGISSKDRSAILPAGRMANGAYWFDVTTGNFISGIFYFKQLPEWVTFQPEPRCRTNGRVKIGRPSTLKGEAKPFLKLPAKGANNYYNLLDRTPFHNDLLELLAEAASGRGTASSSTDVTDVLSVSFSANDRVGHAVGPDAPASTRHHRHGQMDF